MELISLLFLVANGIITIGTIPLIWKAIKNKTCLASYSLFGATMTFLGLVVLGVCWVLLAEWLSLAFALVTIIYWATVVVCKLKWK